MRVPIIAGLLLTTVFVGAFGAYVSSSPSPRVELHVNSIADPDAIGAATQLNVTLDNFTPRPVTPSFFVKWNLLPYLWASNSNATLQPSSTARYTVSATDGLAAIPRATSFRVYVFDSQTGSLVGESLPLRADTSLPAIANPQFRWWTLDVGAGTKVPFSWKVTKTNIDPLTTAIQGLDPNQNSGIGLHINYTIPSSNLERVTISQKVALNATRLNISVFDPLQSTGKAVLGVTITDGAHELSYIFSNSTLNTTLSGSGYNSTLLVPTSSSAWTTVSIDANSAWEAQGWALPSQVTFTIFLQANSAGFYQANIRNVEHTASK
jgi:hypothetical protein